MSEQGTALDVILLERRAMRSLISVLGMLVEGDSSRRKRRPALRKSARPNRRPTTSPRN